MTQVLIAGLSIGALYLAKRWFDARAQIAELQAQVATLKRRLTRREG